MITPYHVAMLAAAATYYALTRKQIQALCCPADRDGRATRKRLLQLVQMGLLAKTRMEVVNPRTTDGPMPVYHVTQKGKELLAGHTGSESWLLACSVPPQWTTLLHTVVISQFQTAAAAHKAPDSAGQPVVIGLEAMPDAGLHDALAVLELAEQPAHRVVILVVELLGAHRHDAPEEHRAEPGGRVEREVPATERETAGRRVAPVVEHLDLRQQHESKIGRRDRLTPLPRAMLDARRHSSAVSLRSSAMLGPWMAP